jgi:hypothetical protein
MPKDNAKPVPSEGEIEFPQDGAQQGKIRRLGPGAFLLPTIGTYRVTFSVSISEPAQLQLVLDGKGLATAVYGRDTGMSQVVGDGLVTTTGSDSVLSVVNAGPADITLTPFAGGSLPVAASLVIEQFN